MADDASAEKPLRPDGPDVSFKDGLKVWVRVAALSFGGPAGQIGVMHRILVREKKWISEERFLHALNYCMLLPGPEAQQLAIYNGWLLHGTKGGLAAGVLFVLPGFASILALSLLYASYREVGWVHGIFFGIKAAVLAIVIDAALHIGQRALQNVYMYAIAAGAFIAIFFMDVPFPLIVLAAALAGLLGSQVHPSKFIALQAEGGNAGAGVAGHSMRAGRQAEKGGSFLGHAFRVCAVWLTVWLGPLAVLAWTLGPDHVFTKMGLFFSKLAVVTFGGAYAVLAYMAQEAVQTHGWLAPGEMLDGLGMAETTPGPLIQVVQFVAFMGAFRDPGELSPLAAAVLASVLVTWVTFVPCFLWIFLGAPYVERLRGNRPVTAALSGITAAVVGVILNLALWFGLHVAFGQVHEVQWYWLRIHVPEPATINPASVLLTVAAFVALMRFKLGMLTVIALSAALGVVFTAWGSAM